MYAGHQGAQALRTEFSVADMEYQRDGKTARFWGLNGSASRKGNMVTLTAVNPDLSKAVETEIALRGVAIKSASGTVLTASDMHAHNTFEQPDAVKTTALAVTAKDDLVRVIIPAASVVKVEVLLG